jgi:hypothetical protein
MPDCWMDHSVIDVYKNLLGEELNLIRSHSYRNHNIDFSACFRQ